MEPTDPGHEGYDCYVAGKRVQIKATSKLRSDGRITFYAGSGGRFDHYRDKCDIFVFVITAPSDLYGRMLVMEAGVVINRWPASTVALHPLDFPRLPDLTLLHPPITDKALEELLTH